MSKSSALDVLKDYMKNKKFCINHTEETSENPKKEIELLEKLLFLVDEGELFFSEYDDEIRDYSKTSTFVHVNCNDVFAFACADAEQIRTYGDFEDVCEIYALFGGIGLVAWCAQKRGSKPVVKRGRDITENVKYQDALKYIEKKHTEISENNNG